MVMQKISFSDGNLIVEKEIMVFIKEDLKEDVFKDFWLVFLI